MPMIYPGSTTSVAPSVSNQTVALSAAAKQASRLQIINASGGLVFVRVTNSTDNVAATNADIPVVVTQNNPYLIDKKAGDDRISILGTVASGTVYFTAVDGFQ